MSRTEEKNTIPEWTNPMLATLTDDYFSDPEWIYERKLDGVRCLVFCDQGEIRIMSRNRNKLNAMYPELTEALKKEAADNYVVDGEIVTFDGNLTSFSKLQQRINVENPDDDLISEVPVMLYLFDILYQDGKDVSGKPLRERKSLLKETFAFRDPLRYCQHRNEEGEAYFREACGKGWEGIIAKNAAAPYKHSRSRDWLKFKCTHQQELVIVGYTEPQGERVRFGALLVGYYEGEKLHFAGKVGTGFTDQELRDLYDSMVPLEQEEPPVRETVEENDIHWIRPELVAEIGFTEWTRDNKLRHPRYLGMRHDKKAKNVVKEAP